jgi:hypothetical protein
MTYRRPRARLTATLTRLGLRREPIEQGPAPQVLACCSAVGFGQDLRDQAARTPKHILLIRAGDLYAI